MIKIKWYKEHFMALVFIVATLFSFSALAYMYKLPAGAILYALVLCFFLAGPPTLWYGYTKKKLINELPHMDLTRRPVPISSITQAYDACIESLAAETRDVITSCESKQAELIDAYTLWAHQMKTPIAALDLLLQTEPDSPKVRTMKNELFKIEQYTELSLHIARLDSVSSDYVFSKVVLEDVVRATIRKYKTIFIEKNNRFEMIGESIPVATDSKWLGVILEQLISNSVKYTLSGKVTVVLEGAVLKIIDTGVGIHPEDLPRIFEKGYTGYNGRMDQKATGIGLYVVKRICERLEVKLNVTSQVGIGTEVTLSFQPYTGVRFD